MVRRASVIGFPKTVAGVLLSLAALAVGGAAQAGTRFSEPGIFDTDTTGSASQSALVVGQDGAMYGTTEFGGEHGLGTIFRFVPGQGIEAVHHFSGKA